MPCIFGHKNHTPRSDWARLVASALTFRQPQITCFLLEPRCRLHGMERAQSAHHVEADAKGRPVSHSFCVLKHLPRVEPSHTGAPHCRSHCHARTATPPLSIALPLSRCLFHTLYLGITGPLGKPNDYAKKRCPKMCNKTHGIGGCQATN